MKVNKVSAEQLAYDKYSAWCILIGLRPAPFTIWRGESRKIKEITGVANCLGR